MLLNIAVLATAGSLLYADFNRRVDAGSRKAVGSIVFKKKTAERKYSGQVLWEEVARKAQVYNRDTIRTAADSQAILTLQDGTRLELDQNTLIVVSMTKKGAAVGFTRGGLATSRSRGAGELKISTGSGEVAVDQGAVSLQSSSTDRVALQVLSGSARLRSGADKAGGETRRLQAGSAAEVVGTAVKVDPDPVQLQQPQQGAYFVTAGDRAKVRLQWKKSGRVRLQYGSSPELQTKKTVVTDSGSRTLNLQPGIYYWRVVRSAADSLAPVRRFTVLDEKPSSLQDPRQGAVFPVKKGVKPLIRFSWSSAKRAVSWQLQLSKDRAFSGKIFRYTANFNEISIDQLSSGKWYWRLQHRYGFETGQPVYSRVGTFEIRTVDRLPKPDPVPTGTVTALQQKNNPLTVTWNDQHALYASYRIEFSRSADFKQVFRRVQTGAQYFQLQQQLDGGTYYWRVRGVAEDGTVSAPSTAVSVKVVPVQAPKLLAPGDNRLFDLSGSTAVKFCWYDPNRSGSCLLRWADNKKMKNAQSVKVKGNVHTQRFTRGGEYYWQTAVIENGKPVKWSAVRRFRLAGKLAAVNTVAPADNSELDMQQRRSINFVWRRVKDADRYRFRLVYFNGRFEKQVFEAVTGKVRLSFDKLEKLQRGTFYWTIQAEQVINGEVVSRSPEQRHYLRIKLRRIKRAPVLIMPGAGVFYVD